MLDDYKESQKISYNIIKNTVAKNKCSHAYIIESNGTSGAIEFSKALAKYLFCPYSYSNSDKCKGCNQCKTIDDGNFIEFKILNPDGMWIKKNQLDLLQKEFQNKSIVGNKKIYIIQDAEKLNNSSSNSILKFLEDPPEGIIAILLVNNVYQLLPTIKSRCQILSLCHDKSYNMSDFLTGVTEIVNVEDIIDICVKFTIYLEQHGVRTILKVNSLFTKYFKDKNNMETAIEIMILFYKKVLNYKLQNDDVLFTKYDDIINNVSLLNDEKKICRKISIILKLKENFRFNMNTSLLMDKLIIEIGRV